MVALILKSLRFHCLTRKITRNSYLLLVP
ncbi:unnamed protein product [Leptidea sinapis]|uniref:Uncharacterized protein n=1 Tax=Leptidea sinapis TaxID=189913 RepID=A0A5E4QS60_9NEOP|nr:unnamed protein product [Leptidea sinapis]